jgi:glutaminase
MVLSSSLKTKTRNKAKASYMQNKGISYETIQAVHATKIYISLKSVTKATLSVCVIFFFMNKP